MATYLPLPLEPDDLDLFKHSLKYQRSIKFEP